MSKMARRTRRSLTSLARITTSAGVCAPGKALWMRSYVSTIDRLLGRSVKLGSCVCMVSVGTASASSTPAETAAEIAG